MTTIGTEIPTDTEVRHSYATRGAPAHDGRRAKDFDRWLEEKKKQFISEFLSEVKVSKVEVHSPQEGGRVFARWGVKSAHIELQEDWSTLKVFVAFPS